MMMVSPTIMETLRKVGMDGTKMKASLFDTLTVRLIPAKWRYGTDHGGDGSW